MALELKSISELENIAQKTTILEQLAALSANDITANIEVSYKNNDQLTSYKIDFSEFTRYLINELNHLKDSLSGYTPISTYTESLCGLPHQVSTEFLPTNYVYTDARNMTLNIYGKKCFNVTDDDKITEFYTPVNMTSDIDYALYVDKLSSANLTCTNTDGADLTAKCARWA